HDHYRNIGASVNRGLFGGLVVLPEQEYGQLPRFPYPPGFEAHVHELLERLQARQQHYGGRSRRPAAGGMGTMGSMPMPAGPPTRGLNPTEIPGGVAPSLVTLDKLAPAPQPLPPHEHLLHVPLFFHQMSGARGTPVFQSAPLNAGGSYTSPQF